METQTDVQTVPRGFPPEQPVELVRVTPKLLRVSTLALVGHGLLIACVVWLACEVHCLRSEQDARHGAVLSALTGGK